MLASIFEYIMVDCAIICHEHLVVCSSRLFGCCDWVEYRVVISIDVALCSMTELICEPVMSCGCVHSLHVSCLWVL